MTCHCDHLRESTQPLGYAAVPLLHGDAGVAQTIALMRRTIDEGVKDPLINRLAIGILQSSGVPQYEPWAEAEGLYNWWKLNFRFVNDPVGIDGEPKETIRTPRELFSIRAGDCDDFVVGLSILLQSVGFATRIVTVASDPRDPSQFSHTYPEAEIDGEWIPLDAARPGAEFALAPDRVYRKKIWDGGGKGKIPGISFSLSGYAVMRGPLRPHQTREQILHEMGLGRLGQVNETAQDISATGAAAANIILAANAAPQNIYGVVSTSPGSPQMSPLLASSALTASGYVQTPFGVMSTSELLVLLVIGAIVLERA